MLPDPNIAPDKRDPRPQTKAQHVEMELDAQELLRDVIAAVRNHQREVEVSTGVPAPHLRMLRLVRDSQKLTIGEYARRLGLHPSTVSNLIRDLQRLGYIKRERDSVDARRSRLSLTATGAAKARTKVEFANGLLPELLKAMSRDDLYALVQGLQPLVARVPARFGPRAKKTKLSGA